MNQKYQQQLFKLSNNCHYPPTSRERIFDTKQHNMTHVQSAMDYSDMDEEPPQKPRDKVRSFHECSHRLITQQQATSRDRDTKSAMESDIYMDRDINKYTGRDTKIQMGRGLKIQATPSMIQNFQQRIKTDIPQTSVVLIQNVQLKDRLRTNDTQQVHGTQQRDTLRINNPQLNPNIPVKQITIPSQIQPRIQPKKFNLIGAIQLINLLQGLNRKQMKQCVESIRLKAFFNQQDDNCEYEIIKVHSVQFTAKTVKLVNNGVGVLMNLLSLYKNKRQLRQLSYLLRWRRLAPRLFHNKELKQMLNNYWVLKRGQQRNKILSILLQLYHNSHSKQKDHSFSYHGTTTNYSIDSSYRAKRQIF